VDNQKFAEYLKTNFPFKTIKCKRNTLCALAFGSDSYIWLVDQGFFLSFLISDEGILLGTGIFKTGDIIGLTSFNGDNRILMIRSILEGQLLGYQTEKVLSYLRTDNDALSNLLKYASGRLRLLMNQLETDMLESPENRIVTFERNLAELSADKPITINDNVLASYLGMHPASVSRARKRMLLKKRTC
jgi:CRP-like cAMP-binding protein